MGLNSYPLSVILTVIFEKSSINGISFDVLLGSPNDACPLVRNLIFQLTI